MIPKIIIFVKLSNETIEIPLSLLFSLILSNALIIVLTNSSILIIILVITQTFLVCVSTKALLGIRWIAFILFLVFVGGLLVLFIYIISLTPNTQFLINSYTLLIISARFALSIIISWLYFQIFTTQILKSLNINNYYILIKLYSSTSIWITFIAITYLLLVLIVVVYIILTDRSSIKRLLVKPK